jgi:adenosylcobinamide-GDP ribazoletransferase
MRVRGIRSALAFLTVIPVADAQGSPGDRLGRAYFPAVGALVGLAAGGVFAGVSALATGPVAAVAAVATMAVLTGGLHLDGLADAADGLLGGRTPERRLEIMRDSRVGSFGVIALVLLLGGEIAALAGLPPLRALVALVVAGTLSRWAMLGVVALLPYARPSGLGSAAGGPHLRLDLLLGTAIAGLTLFLDWRRATLAAALVVLTAAAAAALARRRIGGATGDVYGATAELCELAALAAFVVHR